MKFTIYYNAVHPRTADLISEEIKGKYIYIDQLDHTISIDNIVIASTENVNQVTFKVNGYIQRIDINPHGKIKVGE